MTTQARMPNDDDSPFDIRASRINSSFWFRHSGLILLSLILILAAALRIHRAGQTTLCFDEIWHLAISTGNGSPHMVLPTDQLIYHAPSPTSILKEQLIWKVWGNVQHALHPPLYFVVLHAWRNLFGASDFAAQSLSITASLLMLIFLYDFARLRFGHIIALLACAIIAVAPMEIFLHQQTRGYALLQLFGMASLCILSRIEVIGFTWRRGVLLCLTTLAMMLTHYFAAGACLAVGIYALIFLRRRPGLHNHERKFVLLSLALSATLFAILWGLFIPAQLKDVATTADTFLKENRPDHILETVKRLILLPALQLFNLTGEQQSFFWPVSALAMVFCLIAVRQRRTALPLFFLAGTFGFVALLDLTRSTTHLQYMRYTMLGLPVVLVLMLKGLQRLGNWTPYLASAAIVVGCVIAVAKSPSIQEEPDWGRMQTFFSTQVDRSEIVVFSSGNWAKFYNQFLYLKSAHYSTVFPRPMILMSKPISPQQQKQDLSGCTVWLISPPVEPREWLSNAEVLETHSLAPNAMAYRLRFSANQ